MLLPGWRGAKTGLRSLRAQVDQGEARLVVLSTAQVRGRFREDDLERGTYVSLEQMPADRRPVGFAEDRVRVNVAATGLERHVAVDREHLDLLVHADRFVLLRLWIEVGDDRAAEGADRGEVGCVESLLVGEARQGLHRLVAAVEHEREGACAGRFMEKLRLHRKRLPRRGADPTCRHSWSGPVAAPAVSEEELGAQTASLARRTRRVTSASAMPITAMPRPAAAPMPASVQSNPLDELEANVGCGPP